jgi:hypothetical protein
MSLGGTLEVGAVGLYSPKNKLYALLVLTPGLTGS